MKHLISLFTLLLFAVSAFADTPPSFPGGQTALDDYLSKNVRYPDNAREMGIEGIVVVGFIVTTDGTLKAIKVVKLVDPDLEKEAVRVVGTMPKWIPAEKNGTPVEAPSQVDVPFILE